MLETLLKEGIPAYAEADSGYFEVLEVQVMLSLLELLDNGRRDLPLLSVLRSPIVGLDSPELAAIRAHAPKTPFCDAAASYAREKEDETALKLRGFFEKMARWRLLARALPLGRLVDVLLQESGYLSFVGALPGGGKRQANLALLSSPGPGHGQPKQLWPERVCALYPGAHHRGPGRGHGPHPGRRGRRGAHHEHPQEQGPGVSGG